MSIRNASLFSQRLNHFPRTEFQCLLRKHGAEKNAKGYNLRITSCSFANSLQPFTKTIPCGSPAIFPSLSNDGTS